MIPQLEYLPPLAGKLGQKFLELSLEMERHTRGQDFSQAIRSFPSEKFHEWCDLAKLLEEMWRP